MWIASLKNTANQIFVACIHNNRPTLCEQCNANSFKHHTKKISPSVSVRKKNSKESEAFLNRVQLFVWFIVRWLLGDERERIRKKNSHGWMSEPRDVRNISSSLFVAWFSTSFACIREKSWKLQKIFNGSCNFNIQHRVKLSSFYVQLFAFLLLSFMSERFIHTQNFISFNERRKLCIHRFDSFFSYEDNDCQSTAVLSKRTDIACLGLCARIELDTKQLVANFCPTTISTINDLHCEQCIASDLMVKINDSRRKHCPFTFSLSFSLSPSLSL